MNLGEALLNLASGVGYALDTPGAYMRGLLAGKPGERVGGRELLEALNLVAGNQEGLDVGDVAGFGAEMVLDPLNLLGSALLGKLFKSAKLAKASNVTRKAMIEAGAMPDEVAKLTKIVDDAGMPRRMYHGTTDVFEKYNPSHFDDSALFGEGVYTTSDPIVASGYSGVPADATADQLKLLQRFNRELTYGRKPQPNVRMQYIDARNPINMDEFAVNPMSQPFKQRIADDVEAYVSEATSPLPGHQVQWHVQQAINDVLEKTKALRESPAGDPLWTGDAVKALMERAAADVGGEPQNLAFSMSKVAREMGHDAITHRGGLRSGGGERLHDVVIAFDPSQIYNPYIAPALRDERQPIGLLAALLGYNAGVLPERFQ